jgi:DNA (cytosine-5)-methyltransferase 1
MPDNQPTLIRTNRPNRPLFIDFFAGCGGLSLGLMQAGWGGLFAVEKSPMAFETLKYNLIDKGDRFSFDWPNWLPKEAHEISSFINDYRVQLGALRDVSLLAGGPPCQGFSTSGRRDVTDVRNLLFESYLTIVDLVKPLMILVENVSTFATPFTKTERGTNGKKIEGDLFNADEEIQKRLTDLGYTPFVKNPVMAMNYGVPQLRPRYILIAIKNELIDKNNIQNPFVIMEEDRENFLSDSGLPKDQFISLDEAISDLLFAHGTQTCADKGMRRFKQGIYGPKQDKNVYQLLMRQDRTGNFIDPGIVADSHRFANHNPETKERFERILKEFTHGTQLTPENLEKLKLKKHRVAPLASDQVCHTLTSLPDDLIHYSEPRILTVREYARVQSFPDWFEFKSKYTTGGKRRQYEIPRYTQVANAVPPLLAKALGRVLLKMLANFPVTESIQVPVLPDCI